jgi:hypothetical protein
MNRRREMGAALNPRTERLLAQVLGNTQRIIRVKYDHSNQKFSPRKLIPSEPKTLGDFLLLERIAANLTQQELAKQAGVTELRVRAWEHNSERPSEEK